MTEQTFVYGVTTARDRGTIQNQEKTWPEIVSLFRKPVRRKITTAQYSAMSPKDRAFSKNTGLFFGGDCSAEHRGSDDLVSRSIVNLDLDDHCEAIWEEFQSTGQIAAFTGLTYLIHSTRSSSPEHPKFRILLPLKRTVSPAEYEPVARALAERLDPTMMAVARESFTPAQGMYFPSVSSDQEYHFAEVDGDLFDPRPALKRYPADKASTWPKKPKENVTEYSPGRRMTHPEDKKAQAPIIAAVHRAFDPHTFIEEFLQDVYFSSGDRYSPHGATGAPSVRIYDDAFIQSDHGSDAAVGQHNTFDLGRIHLFGHLDDEFDTASMSPPEWPSYKAMADFMAKREEVAEKLADIHQELEAERNQDALDLLDDLDDIDPEAEDDAEEDLLGGTPEPKKKTAQDVVAKVRRVIGQATSLDDLTKRLEKIQSIPVANFADNMRELVVVDVQNKFRELDGTQLSKAVARKMLVPTVENLRKQAEGKKISPWLKDWVYITSENKFLNVHSKQALPRDGFNGLLSVDCGKEVGVNQLGVPKMQPVDVALSVYDIAKPYATRYHPGQPILFEEDGTLYANTYRPPVVPTGGYKGRDGVKRFKRLLKDLFPAKKSQAIVMDFLAHCVRFPEKKLKYALLVKGAENEGKSLLGMLMRQLLGHDNWTTVETDQLKEKFNGWAHEKLFSVVEEIKIPGQEAYVILNKVKTLITNPVISIRRMQTDSRPELNFCNIYLTTNHDDCLPLEDDNTRFCVLFTRFLRNDEVIAWHNELRETEGEIYTRLLWDDIQERPAQFKQMFDDYEFSEFYDEGGRAPATEFKSMMAEDGKSEERVLLEQLLEHGDDPTISNDILVWSSFREHLDRRDMGNKLHNRAVASFLKPMGFVKARPVTIWLNGKAQNLSVWTKNFALLDRANQNTLIPDAVAKAKAALLERDELDDDDDLADLLGKK